MNIISLPSIMQNLPLASVFLISAISAIASTACLFSFEIGDSSVYYDFYTKHKLLEIKDIYESFIQKNGFDIKKIKTITALIFLNMSPLHMEPFGSMLYHLGRYMLYKTLKNI